MIDELHELRRANPCRSDDFADVVAIPKEDLIVALEADDLARRGVVSLDAHRNAQRRRPKRPAIPARVAWLGAAASIVIAIVALSTAGVFRNGDGLDTNTVDLDVAEVPTTPPADVLTPPTTGDVDAVTDTVGSTEALDDDRSSVADALVTPPAIIAPPALATTIPDGAPPSGDDPSSGDATSSTAVAAAEPTTGAAPTVAPTPTVADTIDGPFTGGVDLLVVHLDFAHTDDGHSALASREVVESLGVDPLVVAGTARTDAFAHLYADLMASAWGTGWIDAAANRTAAVEVAASRWLEVIDGGGDVWVAEGGVSDFSAEVLRRVRASRPDLDTNTRVHVVQHAQRNEDATTAVDLGEVMTNADYIRIDDGNNANDTADLNGASSEFEAAALSGPRAAAWTTGFDYHPAGQLDFSDTVAVLHVLGIDLGEVADADEFAARFLQGG